MTRFGGRGAGVCAVVWSVASWSPVALVVVGRPVVVPGRGWSCPAVCRWSCPAVCPWSCPAVCRWSCSRPCLPGGRARPCRPVVVARPCRQCASCRPCPCSAVECVPGRVVLGRSSRYSCSVGSLWPDAMAQPPVAMVQPNATAQPPVAMVQPTGWRGCRARWRGGRVLPHRGLPLLRRCRLARRSVLVLFLRPHECGHQQQNHYQSFSCKLTCQTGELHHDLLIHMGLHKPEMLAARRFHKPAPESYYSGIRAVCFALTSRPGPSHSY